jgi:hypothetical protein
MQAHVPAYGTVNFFSCCYVIPTLAGAWMLRRTLYHVDILIEGADLGWVEPILVGANSVTVNYSCRMFCVFRQLLILFPPSSTCYGHTKYQTMAARVNCSLCWPRW